MDINDKLHQDIRDAQKAYFKVTKDLHPQSNVAYLPEYQILQQALLVHHNQCRCGDPYFSGQPQQDINGNPVGILGFNLF